MNKETILEIARRYTAPETESRILFDKDGNATGGTVTMTYWNFCEEELLAFAKDILEADRKSSDEPVAYRHFIPWFGWEYSDAPAGEDCGGCVGLYNRPGPARKPLSDEEIREIMLENGFSIKEGCQDLKAYVYAAVRAIEKAHGITEETE